MRAKVDYKIHEEKEGKMEEEGIGLLQNRLENTRTVKAEDKIIILSENLLCAKHCSKLFTCVNSIFTATL